MATARSGLVASRSNERRRDEFNGPRAALLPLHSDVGVASINDRSRAAMTHVAVSTFADTQVTPSMGWFNTIHLSFQMSLEE